MPPDFDLSYQEPEIRLPNCTKWIVDTVIKGKGTENNILHIYMHLTGVGQMNFGDIVPPKAPQQSSGRQETMTPEEIELFHRYVDEDMTYRLIDYFEWSEGAIKQYEEYLDNEYEKYIAVGVDV